MLALADVKRDIMQGFKVITKSQWEALKSNCDFIDYMGECIHRGDTCFKMQVMTTDHRDRVIYDHVIIDPKWR
jgi:hypothetical protein